MKCGACSQATCSTSRRLLHLYTLHDLTLLAPDSQDNCSVHIYGICAVDFKSLSSSRLPGWLFRAYLWHMPSGLKDSAVSASLISHPAPIVQAMWSTFVPRDTLAPLILGILASSTFLLLVRAQDIVPGSPLHAWCLVLVSSYQTMQYAMHLAVIRPCSNMTERRFCWQLVIDLTDGRLLSKLSLFAFANLRFLRIRIFGTAGVFAVLIKI
jgi:hypothetical protein